MCLAPLLVLWMKMVEIPQQGLTFSSQNKTYQQMKKSLSASRRKSFFGPILRLVQK
jgi:hypothetical protein